MLRNRNILRNADLEKGVIVILVLPALSGTPYTKKVRISINVEGTADEPVVIRGAKNKPFPTSRAGATPEHHNIARMNYLTLTGLEITSNGMWSYP